MCGCKVSVAEEKTSGLAANERRHMCFYHMYKVSPCFSPPLPWMILSLARRAATLGASTTMGAFFCQVGAHFLFCFMLFLY
jgi:hypothetical protein